MMRSIRPATGVSAPEPPIPRLQRTLESIPFLIAVGLVLPTLLYTVWSVAELAMLPRFAEGAGAVTHGAAHGATTGGAATLGASAVGGVVREGTAVAPGDVHVAMRGLAFAPTTIEIAAGTTITWTNDDAFDHAVAHGTPATPDAERLFASGDFASGSSFSYTFTAPGTYDVFCSTIGHYQAGMTMTVVVKE